MQVRLSPPTSHQLDRNNFHKLMTRLCEGLHLAYDFNDAVPEIATFWSTCLCSRVTGH
jgi:hypothetical protein